LSALLGRSTGERVYPVLGGIASPFSGRHPFPYLAASACIFGCPY